MRIKSQLQNNQLGASLIEYTVMCAWFLVIGTIGIQNIGLEGSDTLCQAGGATMNESFHFDTSLNCCLSDNFKGHGTTPSEELCGVAETSSPPLKHPDLEVGDNSSGGNPLDLGGDGHCDGLYGPDHNGDGYTEMFCIRPQAD